MTEKVTKLEELESIISEHSAQWNLDKNERLSMIVQNVMNDLVKKKGFLKDAVLSLYVLNDELNGEINRLINKLRTTNVEPEIDQVAHQMFEQQNANIHVEQVLTSLHEKHSFKELYSRNQFYRGVNRFCHADLIIPKGYTFIFANINNTNLLVTVEKDTKAEEIFSSAYFGYFMKEAKTNEEKELFKEEAVATTLTDLLNSKQVATVKNDAPNLKVMSSSALIEEYYEKAKKNLSPANQ